MGALSSQNDYESLRNARIAENKARLAALGIMHYAGEHCNVELQSKKPTRSTKRPRKHRLLVGTALRRSNRLKVNEVATDYQDSSTPKLLNNSGCEIPEQDAQFLSERHPRNIRRPFYDSVVGICCHFCRQKTLCREENCERCKNRDVNLPCIGKTECSSCHSSQGVLCRGCLKVRYGEELEQVKANNDWMCPHCIEEKGIKQNWICTSSLCLKKRKIAPIGFAYRKACNQGYESTTQYLMDMLKGRVVEL